MTGPKHVLEPSEVRCPDRVHGNHEEINHEVLLDGEPFVRGYCRWCGRNWGALDSKINGVGESRGRTGRHPGRRQG